MESNSLECINPAKSLEQAITECAQKNTVVIYSDPHFKQTFEVELFNNAIHYPFIILVDRPGEITEYYKQQLSIGTEAVMLDGLMNLDQVKEDWQEAVRRKKCKVLITSCSTALYAFVHGFVRLGEHFRTLYVPNFPTGSQSGHPFLKLVTLLYDPVIMPTVRIVGLGTTIPRNAVPESQVVFALNEWNMKVRFYALELHCQVVNVIPTLPLPQLELFPVSNFSWSLIQTRTLLGSIKDVRKRMLLVVEEEQLREALLDSLQRRQVTGGLQGVKVFSCDSPFFPNYSQEGACILLCSFLHLHYLTDVNIEEAAVVVKTANNLLPLARVLSRCAIPCQLSATFEECNVGFDDLRAAAELLGQLKGLLSVRETAAKEDKIILKSGAVVHPCIASDLLLRFCSYLPKICATGRSLKGLQIMTVPVRRLDADGEIITTDLNDLFATQIILPERLQTWFPEPIIGRAMSSRADAQASAAFLAFQKLVKLGLVDGNLLAISDIRMQEANTESNSSGLEELEESPLIGMDASNVISEEVIPEQLLYKNEPCVHLYALEYHLEGATEIWQLPSFSRKLLAGGDFFTTRDAAWGVLLPSPIPTDLPPINVALGPEHHLVVTLKSCGTIGSGVFERVLELQSMFFSLLNTRPLVFAEESSLDLTSLQNTISYFLVPLIRNTINEEKIEWKIDEELVIKLKNEREYKNGWEFIHQYLPEINDEGDKEKKESEEKYDEEKWNTALSQLLIVAPYNGMYYRVKKMYMELRPDSPFQVKSTKEATSYLGYIKEKYFKDPKSGDLNVDLTQPLLGVRRIENFADISHWLLATAEDDDSNSNCMSGPMLKKRKREDSQAKSALIPSLVRIVPLPYWRVRMLMVVPKVMSELERQLQAVQFYTQLGLDLVPPIELAVCSLAAVTAGLDYNYERLEVLGDSLLKISVSLELMATEEVLGEGRLSQKRQAKISNVNLFRIGATIGIWKHAALTPFSPKLWTPPGIYALLPQTACSVELSEERRAMKEKLRQVLFDPRLRWKLLKAAEDKMNAREDPWTLTHDGLLLPPSSSSNICNSSNISSCSSGNLKGGLTRYGMAIPNKFVADMVEASVGAYFLGRGMEAAWRYLVHLGILTPMILRGAKVPKLKQMGKLLGDPRDKLPLYYHQNSNINRGKNVSKKHKKALMRKVDWSKLPTTTFSSVNRAIEENENENEDDMISVKVTDMEKEYEAFVSQNVIDFEAIEGILGYKFKERRLLLSAFTHITHNVYFCGERLEWLGDALLDWVVTIFFYQQGAGTRDMNPFELTEARKASVNNVSLSEVTVYYRLHEHLLLGSNQTGKIKEEIGQFAVGVKAKHVEYDVSDARVYWELCQQEPLPPKTLGDLLEAVAGAVFIDLEWDLIEFNRVFLSLLGPFLERHRDPDALKTNPISMCLEGWNRLGVSRADIVFEETNNSDDKEEMTVLVKVRKQVVGTGKASGRMLAKQLAAANAAQLLTTNPLQVQEILKR